MSRRFRRDALEGHRERLQRTVSCVSASVLTFSIPDQAQSVELLTLTLNGGAPAPLSGSPLLIRAYQQFILRYQTMADPVLVTGYNYTIQHPSEGEFVSFQWHPGGEAGIAFPHVHIGPAMSRHDSVVRPGEAHKIHLPTGEVSLAEVLRLAITELGVEPRREDWDAILSRSGARP